jgi:hypothetical protein
MKRIEKIIDRLFAVSYHDNDCTIVIININVYVLIHSRLIDM